MSPPTQQTPQALSARDVIRLLDLQPHPEGGHYRETFRDAGDIPGGRGASTAIYFLLAAGERSHWHRVDAAEVWHFYAGAPLELSQAESEEGPVTTLVLGPDLAAGQRPQAVVPADVWQAAEIARAVDAGGLHGGAGLRVSRLRAGAEGLGAEGVMTSSQG